MKPSTMIVTKRIRHNKHTVAKVGTIVLVEQDFNRIGGVHVLRKKDGSYVCDYGSSTEKEYFKSL